MGLFQYFRKGNFPDNKFILFSILKKSFSILVLDLVSFGVKEHFRKQPKIAKN